MNNSIATNKEYLSELNLLLGDEFEVKTEELLKHNKCGLITCYKKDYLIKHINKKRIPSCPFCSKKETKEE